MDHVDEHTAASVDVVVQAYTHAQRIQPDHGPWVVLNMVTSIDGATSVEGRSGSLGGTPDAAVFHALRAIADVVMVGASTATAERYGPPTLDSDTAAQRRGRGQAPAPAIAVFTRSLDVDLRTRLFSAPGFRPDVVTIGDGPEHRRATAVAHHADVMVAGTSEIDLPDALERLRNRHGPTLLLEGGPTLNVVFAEADLLDELCVTTGPLLVGGAADRLLMGDDLEPRRYHLDQLHGAGDHVFARWLRQRD